MKKTRLLSLILVVVLLLSVVASSSAATAKTRKINAAVESKVAGWRNYRTIANGENVSFVVFPNVWALYEKRSGVYESFEDIVFDCSNKVSGKSNVSWINLVPTNSGFVLNIATNSSLKARTGKVTVTASGYKATLTINQLAADNIVSAKRNKNKVTLKLKKGNSSPHTLYVSEYQSSSGEYHSYTIYDGVFNKTSYSFKVREGWQYYISYGPAVKEEWGYSDSDAAYCYFTVTSVSGEETYICYNP